LKTHFHLRKRVTADMVTRSSANIIEDLTISTKILGLNITGKKTIAVYGDMNGLIYERLQIETPADTSFLAAFDAICAQVDKLLKLCRAQGLNAPEVISVAVSGPLDLLQGVVLSPVDLPTWDNAPLKGRLAVRYNLPVFLEHRSNAGALAEYYFGAGIGTDDFIFLDMEPILSAGLVINGRIFHGANHAAGEIGKLQVRSQGPAGFERQGTASRYASGPGLAELASFRFPERWSKPPAPYELVKAANDGEAEALAIIREGADALGEVLAGLIFTLDPDLVIFGHPGDVLGETLLTPLREAVLTYGGAQARQLPRLSAAKLGAKLDDVAAMAAVIDHFKNRNKRQETI
jgi:glucokinase